MQFEYDGFGLLADGRDEDGNDSSATVDLELVSDEAGIREELNEALPGEDGDGDWEIVDISGLEGLATMDTPLSQLPGIAQEAAKALQEDLLEQFVAFHEDMGGEPDYSYFRDRFLGEYRDMEDYAQQYAEDCMEIPDNLISYIDWEKLGSGYAA